MALRYLISFDDLFGSSWCFCTFEVGVIIGGLSRKVINFTTILYELSPLLLLTTPPPGKKLCSVVCDQHCLISWSMTKII